MIGYVCLFCHMSLLVGATAAVEISNIFNV
jgi:hypothetical protein